MRRIAANRIYLSESQMYTNSYIEIDDEGRFLKVANLSDVQSEVCFTPFYNGVLLPFLKEEVEIKLKSVTNLQSLVHLLFKEGGIRQGVHIKQLTLIEGDTLLSTGLVKDVFCRVLCL